MKLLALLGALLISGCSLMSSPALPAEPNVPQNVAVVVSLRHTRFMPDPGCTAVDIGGGRVVTAKHCVDEVDIGAKTAIGVLTYRDPDHDFAFLVNQEWVKHPAANLRAPILGEHVYAVGYPMQLSTDTQELTVTDGVVCGPSDEEGHLRFTAPIYFGNSGGGVWAEDGSLVGISVSGFLEMPGMNFMVSAEDVANAL